MYSYLVFDLDDTLMDTHSTLVPKAARESCEAMIGAGLYANLEECLHARKTFLQHSPRLNVFTHLVEKFGTRAGAEPEQIVKAGTRAFYQRPVEKNINLFEDALSTLQKLSQRHKLFLVTSGHIDTQKQKISNLGIEEFFARVYIVDGTIGEKKIKAFQSIMTSHSGASAEQFLSIGNRVDTDLAEAKILGWDTCWVKKGEYAHMYPQKPDEFPDYEILALKELLTVCQA